MIDPPTEKAANPAPDGPEPTAENAPGSPGWVPGQPEKRIDRGRGPSCPYRLGY
jgi:hypothetical protein